MLSVCSDPAQKAAPPWQLPAQSPAPSLLRGPSGGGLFFFIILLFFFMTACLKTRGRSRETSAKTLRDPPDSTCRLRVACPVCFSFRSQCFVCQKRQGEKKESVGDSGFDTWHRERESSPLRVISTNFIVYPGES